MLAHNAEVSGAGTASAALPGCAEPAGKENWMTTDEFFTEAKRLNLRMLGTPEETRAALDLKDAAIAQLREQLAKAAAAFEREQDRADAAERDAERYRWLRNEAWGGNNKRGPHLVVFKPGYVPSRFIDLAEEAADSEIDAAMALHNAEVSSGR